MTVRKVERRGERRWVIDIPYRTADGKQKRYRRDAQVQIGAAARAEERRLLHELSEHGTLAKPSAEQEENEPEYTFNDAIAHYRRTYALSRLKPTTRKGYDDIIDRELVPRFGALALVEINRTAVAELEAALAAEELRASTRRNVIVALRSVLARAVEAGMLTELPTLPKLPRVGKTAVSAPRPEELRLLRAKAGRSLGLAIMLAAYAGLRAGEVRALQWPDVDEGRGMIVVRRTRSGGTETKPKSGDERLVPIAAPLLAELALNHPKRRVPRANVALTELGKPWGDSGLGQAFRRAMLRAALTGLTFHSLRHFFVTELCRQGAPTHVVRQLAGHADLSTTQRYAHVAAGDLHAAIGLLGRSAPSPGRGNGVETA